MKILSTGQVIGIAVKTFLKEPMWYLMGLIIPTASTFVLAILGYSLFTTLYGSLMAAPFIMLLAFVFHYFITLASIQLYLACGGKEEICYGISDDCELIEYETANNERSS
ncbi:hypothetical protein [Pseudomonas sp. MF4836]|uniref:hypothetical protein n=1 Tax=Pseudomonas sp. MF4836 TaxID=1960827 RepID=UPI0009981EB0|nr:hypothetical protein [Pseudomonas sp. MF4836]OOV98459.1 hypothetical protein MF4836_08915 [Pseudomonas sp. MF4836]